MPNPPRQRGIPEDERLGQLIRLKQLERPPPAFWDAFDEQLRSRQLAVLAYPSPWTRRVWKRFAGVGIKAAATLAAAAAAALLALALRGQWDARGPEGEAPENAGSPTAQSAAGEEPRFLVDAPLYKPLSPESEYEDSPAVYGVHVLTRGAHGRNYTLRTAPKTFQYAPSETPNEQMDEAESPERQKRGAKVIRFGQF